MTQTTENDYAATAVAEKRLREILSVRFDHELPDMADQMAEILLADTQIEYKPRAKAVTITITVPDKAMIERAQTARAEVDDAIASLKDGSTGSAEHGAPPVVATGIRPFVPVPEPEDGYADDAEFQFA